MNQVQSAGFVLFTNKDNHYTFLLLCYADGHWDFPKGKVEPYESLHDTAVRELYEETGLEPLLIKEFQATFQYVFTEKCGQLFTKTVTLFLAEAKMTDVQLSEEHTDYCWLDAQSAFNQLTYSNAKTVLQQVCNYLDCL